MMTDAQLSTCSLPMKGSKTTHRRGEETLCRKSGYLVAEGHLARVYSIVYRCLAESFFNRVSRFVTCNEPCDTHTCPRPPVALPSRLTLVQFGRAGQPHTRSVAGTESVEKQ